MNELERIANSLEEIARILTRQFGASPCIQEEEESRIVLPEEDLFLRVTGVYLEEEKLKRAKQGQRKSARRVSEKLGVEITVFFEQRLPQFTVSSQKGLILFEQNKSVIAVLKYHTDLGYHRGDHWYKYVNTLVKTCNKKYNVTPDRVFFLIGSMVNGLDNAHVQQILSKDIANSDLIIYRDDLNSYLSKYVQSIPSLPTPLKQVYFLGAEIHPNVLAREWLNTGTEPKILKEYFWLRPSISDLIDFLYKIQ